MSRRRLLAAIAAALALVGPPGAASAAPPPLATDRAWDRLPGDADTRARLRAAARALSGRVAHLAGVELDAARLRRLAQTPREEPIVRAAREDLGRPVDVTDLVYFLDDWIEADDSSRREIWVPSGRARAAGILLHPDDVYGGEPRRYGGKPLALFRPRVPAALEPAPDGAPLGPRWTARFRNPSDEEAMLRALEDAGGEGFADRIRSLLRQCREQGAEAYVFSTVRSRERGYLMYGAFILSRSQGRDEVARRIAKLQRLQRDWGLDIPIRWRHPDGWRATLEAARAMAEAYNVVYATQRGARYSSHYGPGAADFAVMDLPRRLTLTAPDGARKTFDLRDPGEPRDLNLTPRLVEWVERHFDFRKLEQDYPHWSDAAGG